VSRSTAYELPLVDVLRQSGTAAGDPTVFQTVSGEISARYHPVAGGLATRAVVWLPGCGGGLDGPAHGLYRQLAMELQTLGIESLRIDYRRINRIEECVRDCLVGVHWLSRERGIDRIAVVGYSFGAAVALTAGVAARAVNAVAALAAPTGGFESVDRLAKPLFLGHGELDDVVPAATTLLNEERAAGDVVCRIYPGGHHDLEECRDTLSADLMTWLDENL